MVILKYLWVNDFFSMVKFYYYDKRLKFHDCTYQKQGYVSFSIGFDVKFIHVKRCIIGLFTIIPYILYKNDTCENVFGRFPLTRKKMKKLYKS